MGYFSLKIYLILLSLYIHTARFVDSSKCYDNDSKPRECFPEFENVAYELKVKSTNTCGLYNKPSFFLL
jgi:hypothetical protein